MKSTGHRVEVSDGPWWFPGLVVVVLGGQLVMKLAAEIGNCGVGEQVSSAHHFGFCTSGQWLMEWRKHWQYLMAICHGTRKGRDRGSHWSKPVAPPLHSTSQ